MYPRLTFFLTALGALLVIAGLLLPAAFGAAGAQDPQAAPTPAAAPLQTTQSAPIDDAPPPTVAVQRDPFVADDANAAPPDEQSAMILSQTQMMSLPSGMRFISMPNMGQAARMPQAPRDGITGIVVGEHPYALVNADGKTRVLSIGDTFQGHRIARISLQGVTFDDHSTARIPLLDQ
jgi:hypothetical protein